MRAGTTDSCAYGTHSAKFRHAGRTKKSKKTFPFPYCGTNLGRQIPPGCLCGPMGVSLPLEYKGREKIFPVCQKNQFSRSSRSRIRKNGDPAGFEQDALHSASCNHGYVHHPP